jgi:hypothetical protein
MSIKKRAPAHHSSLNTKQDCLKIVDTFRSLGLKLRAPYLYPDREPWWDCEPVLQSKEQERKPLT